VRSSGYLAMCAGYLLLLLAISIGAFLDPASRNTRDPAWMFWIWTSTLTALLLRAPFVGLDIRGECVTRRTWLRSRSWPEPDVVEVRSIAYSGLLNWGLESGRFKLACLTLRDGTVVAVPEVSGSSMRMQMRIKRPRAAIALISAVSFYLSAANERRGLLGNLPVRRRLGKSDNDRLGPIADAELPQDRRNV
jgi:hypothetical protein